MDAEDALRSRIRLSWERRVPDGPTTSITNPSKTHGCLSLEIVEKIVLLDLNK